MSDDLTQRSFERAQSQYDAQHERPRLKSIRRVSGNRLSIEAARRLAKFHDYAISPEFKPGHIPDELKALQ